MRRLSTLVLILGGGLLGCSFDSNVGAPPISCVDGQCPPRFVCAPTIQRCVPERGDDRVAPALLRSAVQPSRVGRGGRFEVSVTADEALFSAPTVRLDGVALPAGNTEGTTATFEHVVRGDEAEGAHALDVILVDEAGNSSRPLALGTVTYDFSAPTLTDFTVQLPIETDGGTIIAQPSTPILFRAVFDEVVERSQLVATSACDAGLMFDAVVGQGTVDYRATAPGGPIDCEFSLTLTGVGDDVGNEREPVSLARRVRVDGLAPTIASVQTYRGVDAGVVLPATTFSQRPGFNEVGVEFIVAGADAVPTVRVGDEPVPCTINLCAPLPTGLRCRCALPVNEADGGSRFRDRASASVIVKAVDEAGNVAEAAQNVVAFDVTPPALVLGSATVAIAPTTFLQAPTRIGRGNEVRLSFTMTEPLGAEPSLELTPAALALPATLLPGSSVSYASVFTLDGGVDGSQTLRARVVDEVGNEAIVGLPALEFDSVPPPPAQVERDGGIVLARRPWGPESPQLLIRGAAGSVEPLGTLVALTGPSLSSAELGRTTADTDGGFSLPLTSSDRPVVYLSVIDAAGNAATPVDVKEVEWLATLRGKVANSNFENPHDFEVRNDFRATRFEPGLEPFIDFAALSARGDSVVSTRGGGRWTRHDFGPQPEYRFDFSTSCDAERQRVIVFGGIAASGPLNETLQWNGVTWTRPPISGAVPSARRLASMAYDPLRKRTVLFGGYDGTALGETWEFDDTSWARRSPATSPTARYGASMVFDPQVSRMLMFGGVLPNGVYSNEAWTWNGETWSRVPMASAPTPRLFGAMAYEPVRQAFFLTGGVNQAGDQLDDLWRLDANGWSQVALPANSPKPGVFNRVTLTYDATLGGVVLLGMLATNTQSYEAWLFDGSRWSQLATPPIKWGSGACSFGGALLSFWGSGADSSVQELRDGVWTPKVVPTAFPPSPYAPAMAFDPTARNVVLFGGNGVAVNSTDTWLWKNHRWQSVSPTPNRPPPTARYLASMATDWVGGRVVLFGGFEITARTPSSSLFSWNGTDWTELDAGTRQPPPLLYSSLVIDRGVPTVVGGQASGFRPTAHRFIDGGWVDLPLGAFGEHGGLAAAYDSTRNRALLFGGADNQSQQSSQTWALEDGGFRLLNTSGAEPPPRWAAQATYDSVRDTLIVVGGFDAARQALGDTWELNLASNTWLETTPRGIKPSARIFSALAYDPVERETLLYGSGDYSTDTWTYAVPSDGAPAHIATFDLSAAGIDDGVVSTAELTWVTGATGAPSAGSQLLVYQRGWWQQAAQHVSATPTPLVWRVSDRQQLDELFAQGTRQLAVAARPRGSNGTSYASLTTDWLELRVRYRRP